MHEENKTKTRNALGIFLLVIIVIAIGFVLHKKDLPANGEGGLNQGTSVPVFSGEETLSTGDITFVYRNEYGLAVTKEQILVSSYIPPCDENFDYCFYYNGSQYAGTNFESAGLRIKKRTDLVTENTCTNTLPDGYSNLAPVISSHSNYTTSLFTPLSDAGLGHYANGSLYRLFVNDKCYEFETRIGASQFANWEPGMIKEFTATNRLKVENDLASILEDVKITRTGEKVAFPKAKR